MADKKISALTGASTPLAGTEVLPIVQSGATVKVAVSDLTAGRAISATQITLTAGNVIPASGYGIDFSATSGTGTSELLADYEEGTWTCSFSGQTATATGYYTKVGRTVTVWCQYTGDTNAAAAGALVMSGLPFTASANSKHYSPLFIQNGNAAGGNNVETFATGVVPMMRPDGYIGSTSTGSNSYYAESLIQNGTAVYINFSYFV